MIKVSAHRVVNDIGMSCRTEDIKFSPSGRRLALAATEDCIVLYEVDLGTRPIGLAAEMTLRSPALLTPHGVDFLTEDILVVANRNGRLAFFRVPPADQRRDPCEVMPLLEVQSRLFGATGVRRGLRERQLYCGPGSVRMLDGILYVSCNFQNTVSTFACHWDGSTIQVEEGIVVAQAGLEIVDGIALSRDGRLMALSDHDHARVAVYRRVDAGAGGQRNNRPVFELACSLSDVNLRYPHGIHFDAAATCLYVADAGGRDLHIFTTTTDWRADALASACTIRGVDEAAYEKSRAVVPPEHRKFEGGIKGLDIDPAGKIMAVTCRNQTLRFLELDGLAAPAPTQTPAVASSWRQPDMGIALSCLVDDSPAIWQSIVPWLATAIGLAGIPPGNIHVHHVCALRPDIARLCLRLGVQTHAVKTFDPRNLYANKIMQGSTQYGQVKSVVLTDVDIVFTEAPPFSQLHGVVAGKPVDKPNPPLALLREVFSFANIPFTGICTSHFVENGEVVAFETLHGNFNGGMHVIPFNVIASLTKRWAHWTRWLIDNSAVLGEWVKHADQVGFNLAVSELRLPLRILDNLWNYPAHLGQLPVHADPWILHHHTRLAEDGTLLPVAGLQEVVDKVNAAVRAFKRVHEV